MLIRTKRASGLKTFGLVWMIISCVVGTPFFFMGIIDTFEGDFDPFFVVGLSLIVEGVIVFIVTKITAIILEAAIRVILKFEEEEEKKSQAEWQQQIKYDEDKSQD